MSLPSRYSTVQELQSAPLGLSIKDIPQGKAVGPNTPTGVQVYDAINTLIYMASSAADSYCRQIITATQETEQALSEEYKVWIDREGYLWMKVENFPIVSVSEFAYASPNQSGAPNWLQAPSLDGLIYQGANMVGCPGWFVRRGSPRIMARVTYVNGYANTFLTAATLAGATTLPVEDLAGFYPGQGVTIYDLGNNETVRVDSSFTAPSLTSGGAPVPGSLPLASPTAYAHTPVARSAVSGVQQPFDVRVSAVPYDFTWAVLLTCKFFIQERGTSALVMGAVGGVKGPMPKLQPEEIPLEAQYIFDKYAARF